MANFILSIAVLIGVYVIFRMIFGEWPTHSDWDNENF